MKKFFIMMLMLFVLSSLVACNGNDITQTLDTSPQSPTDIENGLGRWEWGESDDGIFVQFDNLGFSLVFPDFWEGKFGFEELYVDLDFGTRHFVTVYHIATREEMLEQTQFPYGGRIFTLGRSPQEHYSYDGELPIMAGGTILLAQTGGNTYFVNFPSGVEHNEDPDSQTRAEYLEMVGHWESSHWDFLTNSFKLVSEQAPVSSDWTIGELGATIVAAGEFWNKWWASHHTFEWDHIDDSRRNWQPWDEAITPAHHPLSRGFAIILPSSGFESLEDISTHLSQFYTQSWLDRGLLAEPVVYMTDIDGTIIHLFGFGFEEYDNELFVFIQTEMSARPDWQRASHTLIEQDGNHKVVETIVPIYIHGHNQIEDLPTITYRFTFIDGRIESGTGVWNQSPSPPSTNEVAQDATPWEGTEFGVQLNDVDNERPSLFIAPAYDSLLSLFEHIHEVDYTVLRTIRDGAQAEPWGDRLVIWARTPLFQLEVINITGYYGDYELFFVPSDSHGMIDVLHPGQAYVINNYIGMSTIPWSGITFLDEQGERHHFFMQHDNSDSQNVFILGRFEVQ